MSQAHNRLYPWDRWFRHRRVELLRGSHYRCTQSTMAQMIRNAASARGLGLKLKDTGSGFVLEVLRGTKRAKEVPDGGSRPQANLAVIPAPQGIGLP